MYYFKYSFAISGLCIFITSTCCDPGRTDIREKGSISDNVTVNAVNNTPILVNNKSLSLPHIASEGRIISSTEGTHNGREHVLDNPVTKLLASKDKDGKNVTLTKPEDNKSVQNSVISTLDVAPQQDDEKPSVPKKGVIFSDVDSDLKHNISTNTSSSIVNKTETYVPSGMNTTSNQNSSMNGTAVHKKPLVTESDSDFMDLSSKKDGSKENIISEDQIDPLLVDNKSKRSDYIIPIVAVILSVPLVAIITSVLYKRGTDWWQHRNYKRMDFLIEGMYHN